MTRLWQAVIYLVNGIGWAVAKLRGKKWDGIGGAQ